ncbi:hypothetical protein scyTo_0002952 [Scyliorhinus torazame]|uniref:Tropoelastin n=2 Tax=Scyliorhinus torazame TaxID=75743 RepID=A0A401PL76_SCYTO|nr:hypothetical protein [Scyliorhinus torazame]
MQPIIGAGGAAASKAAKYRGLGIGAQTGIGAGIRPGIGAGIWPGYGGGVWPGVGVGVRPGFGVGVQPGIGIGGLQPGFGAKAAKLGLRQGGYGGSLPYYQPGVGNGYGAGTGRLGGLQTAGKPPKQYGPLSQFGYPYGRGSPCAMGKYCGRRRK